MGKGKGKGKANKRHGCSNAYFAKKRKEKHGVSHYYCIIYVTTPSI